MGKAINAGTINNGTIGLFEMSLRALKRIRERSSEERYCPKKQQLEIPIFSMRCLEDGIYINDLLTQREISTEYYMSEENATKQAEIIGELLFNIFKNSGGYIEKTPALVDMCIMKDAQNHIEVAFGFSMNK